ncbi:MAG: hypothetical protein AB7S38_20515 [Vulcanimicrobiota bacterium]
MRSFLLLVLLALPASADPIDQLVTRLSQTHGLWINGPFPALSLGSEATCQQVLDEMFTRISFDPGRVERFQVDEQRNVTIDGLDYVAVKLTTNLGQKIVLLRYESGSGWWTRVY